MAEEFHVYCEREKDLEGVEALLGGLSVGLIAGAEHPSTSPGRRVVTAGYPPPWPP